MVNTESVSGTTMTAMSQGPTIMWKVAFMTEENSWKIATQYFEIIDVIRKEQATTEMKLNQFEANDMQPSRKRRYV